MAGKFVINKGTTGGIRSVQSPTDDATMVDQTIKEWSAAEAARKAAASAKKLIAQVKATEQKRSLTRKRT